MPKEEVNLDRFVPIETYRFDLDTAWARGYVARLREDEKGLEAGSQFDLGDWFRALHIVCDTCPHFTPGPEDPAVGDCGYFGVGWRERVAKRNGFCSEHPGIAARSAELRGEKKTDV